MTLAAGFDRPVHDAQACFRAVMDAFARPGLPKAFVAGLAPPAPLTPELAAVALTLADHDAPVWLDQALARSSAVREFLRFHTGAPIVERAEDAAFALIAAATEMPELFTFAQGTDAYPDRSATLVVAVESIADAPDGLVLSGPGIRDEARLSITPQPPRLAERLRANAALFPRGVDLLFVAPGRIAAIPRSTRVTEAA